MFTAPVAITALPSSVNYLERCYTKLSTHSDPHGTRVLFLSKATSIRSSLEFPSQVARVVNVRPLPAQAGTSVLISPRGTSVSRMNMVARILRASQVKLAFHVLQCYLERRGRGEGDG